LEIQPEYRTYIQKDTDVRRAALVARQYAQACGFSVLEQWRIATIAAELSSNLCKHVGEGVLILRPLGREKQIHGLVISTRDRGPFIGDPKQAFSDGYSKGRMWQPQEGDDCPESLGVGLGTVKRMSDRVIINITKAGGTVVVVMVKK